MKVTFHSLVAGIAVFAAAGSLSAQAQRPPLVAGDTVLITPSDQYGKSPLLAPLTGRGHRDLWATPIRVPVADLRSLGGGGLTAERIGGGFMTRTLHMRGANGREYVLRTVDKFPAQGLPDELKGTVVADVVQGEVASFNPSGALVAAPLLDAVGVLHATPTYYVVPDDPRLGKWRDIFAGKLVLFEERPREGPDDTAGFAGSRDIRNTDNFRDELERSSANRLDSEELLRSRLVDMLLGDRDRSVNNWLWARFDAEDGYLWRPLPRDRDQVFVNYDGLTKVLARRFDPRLIKFDEEIPSVYGLSRNAWDIDRNLLVDLDRAEWERITSEVQGILTDAVIERAVRSMPREHYAVAGPQITEALESRRGQLRDAARDLYDIVNRFADVSRTDDDELARIRRLAGGDVQLDVYGRPEAGEQASGAPHFSRRFLADDTDEVRLYLHGGDDLILVEGDGPTDILIRIIGGGGTDDLQVRPGTATDGLRFYDEDDTQRVSAQGRVLTRDRRPRQPEVWPADGLGPRSPDWGGLWAPLALAGYSSENGVVFGGGLRRTGFSFEQDPYHYTLGVRAGFATGPQKPIVEVDYERQNLIRGVDLLGSLLYTPIDVLRFNGFGNETEAPEADAFYDPVHTTAEARLGFRIQPGTRFRFYLGGRFRRVDSDTTGVSLGLLAAERPYGSGEFQQASVFGEFAWDGREIPGRPSRGVRAAIGGSASPEALDLTEGAFGDVHGEVDITLARRDDVHPQLGVRLGGRKVFGTYPFSEGAFLGGPGSLRGIAIDRYLGDAVVYGSLEGRAKLFRWNFLIPADYGALAFVDGGRVFLDDEESDTWHAGYGGGLWISPAISEFPSLSDLRAIASMGFSDGTKKFYFSTGYLF